MSDGVGLSVGATNLAAVVVGRTAVTRSPVLTRYPHRPPEVGVPSENPDLNERGLIITDFVDRVGDPVGILAADGSTHRADGVLADALRALLYAVGRGQQPADPVGVTYPAHWRPAAVDALRNALAGVPEFQGPKPAQVVPDATAALIALQDDPGVPTRGTIAVCDFGGSGTSITLVDAANGFSPVGQTVRHTDLSGDLVDQALLTHVINDLPAAETIDLSGTSAIGSLSRLRAQCRGAKERLSTAGVTALVAELPGHRSDVRLTRNELDEAIRQPIADFVAVLQDTLERNGVQGGNLVAVASVGGGARIPILTTTLSERFRVPVITTGQPELTAAIGGGLTAVRGTVVEGMTSMAAAAPVAAALADDVTETPAGETAVEHFSGVGVVRRRRHSRSRADRPLRIRPTGRQRRYPRRAAADGVRPRALHRRACAAAVVPAPRRGARGGRGRAPGRRSGRRAVRDARRQRPVACGDNHARHHHTGADDHRRPATAAAPAPDDAASATADQDNGVPGAAPGHPHPGAAADHRGDPRADAGADPGANPGADAGTRATAIHAAADHPVPRRSDDSDRTSTGTTASLGSSGLLGCPP